MLDSGRLHEWGKKVREEVKVCEAPVPEARETDFMASPSVRLVR